MLNQAPVTLTGSLKEMARLASRATSTAPPAGSVALTAGARSGQLCAEEALLRGKGVMISKSA